MPANLQCYRWADALMAAGHRVIVPEIADFEVRRELLRLGRTKGIARLDLMQQSVHYAPLTTSTMLRAAELWADVRRRGLPTAAP